MKLEALNNSTNMRCKEDCKLNDITRNHKHCRATEKTVSMHKLPNDVSTTTGIFLMILLIERDCENDCQAHGLNGLNKEDACMPWIVVDG